MTIRRRNLPLAFLIFFALPLSAQQGSLQGIVTDSASGQRLSGVQIMLEVGGEVIRTVGTDREGLYLMGSVAPGAYTLRASLLGYATHVQLVQILPGESVTASIRLGAAPLVLEGVEIEVVVDREGAVLQEMGGLRITPGALRRVPTPGASGDLASYLQVLPGVVTLGDRGGQLFVRGGTHTENLTLMDGVPIFQPFHIVGFFSAFPEDLVSSVDFFAGGFGARYNGRTSSVMDVQMRDGNRNEYEGALSLSPMVVEARVEGPLRPGISWMASARRSLIEETSPSLLGEEQPLFFESQYLRVSSVGDTDTRCSGLALRTRDEGRLDPQADDSRVGWKNVSVGGRCTGLFDGAMRFAELVVGYSSVENESIARGTSELSSSMRQVQFELNSTHLVGGIRFNVGYHVKREDMSYDLRELFSGQVQKRDDIGLGAFAEAIVPIGDELLVIPGVVATAMPSGGFEPRLRFSWSPTGSGGEMNGALGVYRQTLTGISDTRDVSSIFVAWMRHESGEPSTSVHAQLGWQQSHPSGVYWSVEGYHRRLTNVAVPLWKAAAVFNTELGFADGRVYGVDAKIEYERGPFYGFLGYGLSWTEYQSIQQAFLVWYGEPVQSYHPPHDRRHQANAMLNWEVGGISLRGRWQIGTGLPFTRPLGFDEALDFRFRVPDVNRDPGTTRMVTERPYLARLPLSHRLDLSVERIFETSRGDFTVQAGAINAYDKRNIFYYDLYTATSVDQLPLLPYLSVKAALH